ncbi:ACP phosphodiesterase [Pseudomonas sp. HR96]|uniref:acyl carrier protein phosphodiesterase n=1 Tax=Pseudomonas sp. HR96 TaxID=1027966 RepID=UPI002A761B2F|nr:ACP phosphodiesterase [Pseudomonas sp. HR96]WPO99141.1 ACP phosphodiesterase [Pseudomonas sp. HR96]
MNYLAHLHLGGPSPQQMLGSLYGDFVKGRLEDRFPPPLEAAIRLHRRIDAYTDSHPLVLAALQLFSPERRRYAGIIVDVFFDHVLARHWREYHPQPLDHFTRQVYQVLRDEAELPGRLAMVAPHMIGEDWLGSYRDFRVIEQVLNGIARRLSRPEGLHGAYAEVRALYEPLSEAFRGFYPQVQAFAREQQQLSPMP